MIGLRSPLQDILMDGRMMATQALQNWMNKVSTGIPSYSPINVQDFSGSDTEALQAAINKGVNQGGATIIMPPRTYDIDGVTFPAGSVPLTLMGFGDATVLRRKSNLAAGKGMLDILGSNVTLDSFLIDGSVTVPVGLLYNGGFSGIIPNDPMAASLTGNSSVWVHGPAQNFAMQRVTVTHTGGYAVLIDALTGEISDVTILNCWFRQNRPHLFGTVAGQEGYGSWTGGVLLQGDGRAANPGRTVKRFFLQASRFQRNTGNQCWQAAYGLDDFHQGFQVVDCFMEDIGLDGILAGAVIGGIVAHNVLHRIGYVCETDTDDPTPRWLPNLNATAIDSSGIVVGVNYQGNSIISPNGGGIDGDGHSDSSWLGNLVRIPVAGDPDYDTDRIAVSGIANSGSSSYGLNLGNTANTPFGGKNVTIVGNTLLNLPAGSVRLYSARNCLVEANDITVPNQPIAPPIAYGPGGPGANQQPTGNVIKHNRVRYSPPVAAPVIFEDPSVGPFTAAEINYVFGNNPILGNGSAFEFQKDAGSGSPVYGVDVWFP